MLLFTLAVAAMGAGCSQASDTQPTSTAPDAGVPTDSVQPTTPTPDMNPAPTVPAVNEPPTTQPPTTQPPKTEPPVTPPPAKSTYKDGTYSADGSYRSPAGTETIGVTITLKGDVITKVTVVPKATDPKSDRFQDMFASGISEVVVGKKIDTLQVSKISGSSLTSGGFNEAVTKIEAAAKNS